MQKPETKKGAILYSTTNLASKNILENLKKIGFRELEKDLYFFSFCSKSDCCSKFFAYGFEKDIIDIEPKEEFREDYFLYASSHKSQKELKSLTVHFPGNWADAEFSGEPKKLNYAFASKTKQILKILYEENKKNNLNYQVSLEVDHHGPTIKQKKPLIFVEIGSTREEWENPLAGQIVARAIFKALLIKAEEYPTYIGFGGGHYCPKFNDYVLGRKKLNNKEIAIAHICPNYLIDKLDSEILQQALKKNFEKIEGILIDKKGTTKEQKQKVLDLIKEFDKDQIQIEDI
jgi:D-aminoacyl-tRNA deacylase